MFLIQSLFLGILAAFFALVLEIGITSFFPENLSIFSFLPGGWLAVVSVLVEEISKATIIYKISTDQKRKTPLIINGIFMAIGFSATEIMLNLFQVDSANKLDYSSLGGIIFVHLITIVFISFFLQNPVKIRTGQIVSLVLLTSFFHLSYNLTIISQLNLSYFFPILLVISFFLFLFYRITVNFRKIREAIRLSNKNN